MSNINLLINNICTVACLAAAMFTDGIARVLFVVAALVVSTTSLIITVRKQKNEKATKDE